jgi:AmmeMemoRadiSam system protein B
MTLVRKPAVAGLFYPAEPGKLRRTVDGLLRAARAEVRPAAAPPKALIVPHAGYRYSGSTAAQGYATLLGATGIEHVVLLGPCHRVGVPALALPGATAMATPLGLLPVWEQGVQAVAGLEQVVAAPPVHADEHSLEVHFPFIQEVLPQADVLPLAVGWVAPEQVAQVLDAVWGGPETLVVVSSDLSHYQPYAAARQADQTSIEQVLALGPPLTHEQACGATPVNGLLVAAREHRLAPTLLAYRNSGDTAGDKGRVVGYAAIRFDPENRQEGERHE